MVDALDDTQLVRAARQGDERAYGQLVLRYRGKLFATLLRLVRSRPDAENLCQETFLKAYLSLGSFEERSSFSTWVYRIAVNLGLNHIEKHKRIVRWDDEAHEDLLRVEPPTEEVEQRDELARLRGAIDSLPPRQRATVLLRDVDGLTFEEVAAALECPVGTAKANHFHAIRNLRKRLVGEDAGAPRPAQDPARFAGGRA